MEIHGQRVLTTHDRRLTSHLHSLERPDELEVEAKRAPPPWTGRLVSSLPKKTFPSTFHTDSPLTRPPRPPVQAQPPS